MHPPSDSAALRARAWRLAHVLLDVARLAPAREQVDLINISTAELCRAMGAGEQGKLEEVRDFVYLVLGFMRGYGISVSCGCGYLSLRVTTAEIAEGLLESDREISSFTPEDLEAYFEDLVMSAAVAPQELAATCDADQVRRTLVKLG
jgi:hypothetical protein